MDPKIIRTISQEVYRRFPDFKGVRPKVKPQSAASQKNDAATFLLTFNMRVNLPGEKTLPRWVRVVVDDRGKIIKISTSR